MAKRNDITVKIDNEVVRIGKIVAAYRDVTLAEYFSDLLMPLVIADLEKEQANMPAKIEAERRVKKK